MFTWLIVIIFLVALFYLYNTQKEESYTYHGDDAPIPAELHPIVEEKKRQLIDLASSRNIQLVITEEIRSFERQNALYEQGRTKRGNIVTNSKAGESYHNYGLAFDYALKNENGDIIWDIHYDGNHNGEADWFEVADIAKQLGFDWGGDWANHKDYPHLQMTFGLSVDMLEEGYRP